MVQPIQDIFTVCSLLIARLKKAIVSRNCTKILQFKLITILLLKYFKFRYSKIKRNNWCRFKKIYKYKSQFLFELQIVENYGLLMNNNITFPVSIAFDIFIEYFLFGSFCKIPNQKIV